MHLFTQKFIIYIASTINPLCNIIAIVMVVPAKSSAYGRKCKGLSAELLIHFPRKNDKVWAEPDASPGAS